MVASSRLALVAAVTAGSLVQAGNIQLPFLVLPPSAPGNAKLVKDAFAGAYADYKKYAWGHDDLAPLTSTFVDGRNGWGATIVDAMTTMHVMGLNDIFAEAVNFTGKIDFSTSHTPDQVSVFETTIRYLGSMLASYELNGKKDKVLLQQAIKLGDKLAFAWVGNNPFPYNNLDMSTTTVIPTVENSGIAVAGTLQLEFYKLSLYSGNATYQTLAEKSMKQIATNPAPLPGLAPQDIVPSTGAPSGDYITWGGGSDSYFEYLIKYGRLTNNASPLWVQTWKEAVDSSIKYLAKTSIVGNHLYLTDYTGGKNRYISSHLACFHGGNWIMGGKLLNNQTIVDYGLKLTDACFNTYTSTTTGIGPEVFAFASADGNYTGGRTPSADDLAFNAKHGFYFYNGADYAYYYLRPEVLESNFYAWRATGDPKYQARAAAALQSILKYVKAPLAFAPINDVRSTTSGFMDDTESFFFAEVMKYLFLTFDDPKHISLDKYVFNTEAHPFIAPPALPSYNVPSKTSKSAPWTPTIQSNVPAISPAAHVTGLAKIIKEVLGL